MLSGLLVLQQITLSNIQSLNHLTSIFFNAKETARVEKEIQKFDTSLSD